MPLEGAIGAMLRGRNGRLFLGNQDGFHIQYFTDGGALTRSFAQAWRRTFERRARLLAERGIPYVVFICPEAHTIYPEDLPDDVPGQFLAPGEQLCAIIDGLSNLTLIYPRQELLSAKGGLDLYKKNDTHWSDYGGFIGYQALCDGLERIVPLTRIAASDVDFKMRRSFGDLGILVEPEQADLVPVASVRGHEIREVGWGEGVGRLNLLEAESPTAAPCRGLFFRDSAMTGLFSFIGRSFSNVLLAGTTTRLYLDEVDRWRPDIVVSQIAERRLFQYQADHQLELFDDTFRSDYRSPRGNRALLAMLKLTSGSPAEAADHIAGFENELESLPPDHCFAAARVWMANGRLDLATPCIARALAARPDHASYRCLAALASLGAGAGEEALALCRHAIELAPYNGHYHESLGYILLSLDRADEARGALDRAVEAINDSGNLWYWTSVAREAAGDRAGAVEAAEQALALDPEDPVYREHEQRLGDHRVPAAIPGPEALDGGRRPIAKRD